MIKIDIHKTICSFLVLLAASIGSAQQKTTVNATIDRNRILIGQPIKLTLEADIPENEPIRFFSLDSLPPFEILEKEEIDTTNTSRGTFLSQVIRITSFDSGHWVLAPFTLGESAATDSLPVDVVFSAFDPNQDYHDIKDIIDVKPPGEKKTWWWYVIGGAVIVVALLLYYLLQQKKPGVKAPEPVIIPYEEAMQQLDELKRQTLEQKQYYSRLVDIFRVYVFRKKDIHSLQKTTDDLVVRLKTLQIPKEQFEKLSQTLRLSDFVKFAKYVPAPEDDEAAWKTIRQSIHEIEQVQ